MRLRDAKYEDIPWASAELDKFVASIGHKYSYLPKEDLLKRILSKLIDAHVFIIAEDDSGSPIGMIAGEYLLHPFNEDVKILSELFWWVSDGARRSGAGGELLSAFLAIAEDTAGVVKVCLEWNSPVPEEYLEQFGLNLAEKTFVKEF